MTIPIARFLAEFAAVSPAEAPILLPGALVEHPRPEPDPALVLEHRLEEARTIARADAEARAATALATREAALRIEQAETLVDERRRWAADEGQALAARFTEQLDRLEERLTTAAASIIEAVLPDALARRALDDLRTALGTLLACDASPILIEGRADLVEALARSFAGRPGLCFVSADGPEVTIRTGDTEIRSALGAWAERLTASLGGEA